MALFYLQLLVYSAAGFWLLTRLTFVRKTNIPYYELLVFFLIRIASGIVIGWVTLNFYPGGNDYWGLNEQGINEHHFLVNDPVGFFKDLFHTNYGDYSGMFGAVGTYWNDLKNILIGKFLGFSNFLTGGNYYLNAIIMNCIGFLGSIGFYRGWMKTTNFTSLWAKISAFLIPSALFFSSGIHKDLIIFSLLGIFFYCLIVWGRGEATFRHKLMFVICLLFIFLIRNFLAVVIVPASVLYLISLKTKRNPIRIFVGGTVVGIAMISGLYFTGPKFSIFRIITERQHDFAQLSPAGSDITKTALEATPLSFIKAFPNAVTDGILRPFIWEAPLSLIAFTVEWWVVLMVLCYSIYRRIKIRDGTGSQLFLFSCLVCFCLFITTGYIVNNLGAIVRYRSIYIPLLLYPTLVSAFKKDIL